jgi:hypothetical protein
LDVAEVAVGEADFAEEHGATVSELWDEVSELMAGIGLRDRGRSGE